MLSRHLSERRVPPQDIAVAVAIVIASVTVRAPGIGQPSLSFADAWVASIAHLDSLRDVARVGLTAPGFTMLVKGWFAAVGFSTTAAQMPAFVLGAATPAAAYLLSRRMQLERLPALAAAFVLVVSPIHVDHSVMLKQYTFDGLASIMLLWLAWRVVEPGPRRSVFDLGILVAVAICLSLASASVIPVAGTAVLVGSLSTWRHNKTRAVLSLASYGLLVGAWAIFVLSRWVPTELTDYWRGRYIEGPSDIQRIAFSFGEGMLGTDQSTFIVVVALTFGLGAAWLAHEKPLLTVLLIGPLLVAASLAVVGRVPLGAGRTDIYLYPVLAVAGAWMISRATTDERVHGLIVVILVALAFPFPSPSYPALDSRPLIEVLKERRQPDEQVIVNYGAEFALALYGPWMTGLETGVPTVRGFSPRFSDANIIAIHRRDERDQFRNAVEGAVKSEGVWALFDPRVQDWTSEAIREAMTDSGYRMDREWKQPESTLQLWKQEPR